MRKLHFRTFDRLRGFFMRQQAHVPSPDEIWKILKEVSLSRKEADRRFQKSFQKSKEEADRKAADRISADRISADRISAEPELCAFSVQNYSHGGGGKRPFARACARSRSSG